MLPSSGKTHAPSLALELGAQIELGIGPLSLVNTTEELLDRKIADPV
jgi:hypothetical protein